MKTINFKEGTSSVGGIIGIIIILGLLIVAAIYYFQNIQNDLNQKSAEQATSSVIEINLGTTSASTNDNK